MTGAGSVICRRCGFTNAAGDQFCGSCGVFLEWESEPVEPTPAQAAETAEGVEPRPTEPVEPPAEPLPSPATGSPGTTRPGTVRCPSCGTSSQTTRTFCQSCGSTLPTGAAGRSGLAGPDTGSPWGAPPGVPGASPGGSVEPAPVRRSAAASSERRGLPGWLLGVAALGLLVGAVAVAASILLRPADPSSGATSSVPPSAGPTAPSSPGGSPGSSGPSPDASTAPTPPGEPLELVAATASSIVGNREKFAPDQAIDVDPTTSWQEGSATEAGEWLEVTFAAARVDAVVIHGGYQLSEDAYFANRRPREVVITVDGGHAVMVELQDVMAAQRVELGGIAGATRLRIEIVSTYDPRETPYPGSPFDDMAISEVSVIGEAGA